VHIAAKDVENGCTTAVHCRCRFRHLAVLDFDEFAKSVGS
jgi:hypothetical protein